ncbi:MAG: hypothetical protein C4574_00665 [Candidatus Latescibacterota bacterium]|jgi:hypothetical protein|nr:MAG: hypothetical protein C4574_00665 [Candidatus Latescibacterota bacterium]
MPTNYGNIANVIQGPCLLYVDNGTGERNVGLTLGNVEVNLVPKYREQKFHQFGDTPVDHKMTGLDGSIKFDIAETTIDNLILCMPQATLYTDGADQAVGFGARINEGITDKTVKLRIHPINKLAADGSGDDDPLFLDDDYTFWKVASIKDLNITFKPAEEHSFPCELATFIDNSKPTLHNVVLRGDPDIADIDVTPPAVSSIKAEVSDVLTLIPADAAGLADVDGTSVIEVILGEECKSWMAVQKYVTVIKDADKTVVAGAYVHTVVAGVPNTSKITFTPTAPLTAAAAYQVLVGGIQDISGNAMAGITQRKFTVAA